MTYTSYIVIVLLISAFFLMRDAFLVHKTKSLSIFTVFSVMYVLIHGVLLSYFLSYMEKYPSDTFYLNHHLFQLKIWTFLSLVLYLIIRFVYYWPGKEKQNIIDKRRLNKDKSQSLAVILLFIGSASFFLWSYAYGGIINVVLIGDYIRAGQSQINNSLAFMLHPARVLLFATLLFALLVKKGTRKTLNSILLLISFVLSVFLLLAMDGRFMAAMFFVMLFFCATDIFAAHEITKKKVFLMSGLALLALFFISIMDSITEIIRLGSVSDEYTPDDPFLIREFTYVIKSGAFSVDWKMKHPDDYMIFDDLITGLFAWLPTAFKPDGFTQIWQFNTHLQAGTQYTLAETPCEMVSTSVYDLGFFGIIIFGLFWGSVIRYVDIKGRQNHSIISKAVYCYMAYIFIRLSAYCQLYDVVKDLFPIFVAWFFWRIVLKTRNSNRNAYY